MSAATPSLPFPLRLFNIAGRALDTTGIRPYSLTPAALKKQACSKTGLDDFGDSGFEEGLARLTASLESEGQLTLFGRMLARSDLTQLLANRLQLIDYGKRYPEIHERPIRRPVFILGLPRTGTSIMHELLAQDPDNRVPLTWESKYPFPPPRRQTYRSDPRIATVSKELGGIDRLLPEFKKMHRMGAELPQECVAITSMNFMSILFDTAYRVPSYQHWLDHEADLGNAYDFHHRFLQYLQWQHPAERWVLKSPGHLWSLDRLLDRYPDALIIHTHRDPVKVLTSVSSLIRTLRTLVTDRADIAEIAEHYADLLADGLERCIRVRDSGRLAPEQVYDLNMGDFVRDPVARIDDIYRYFGFTLSNAATSHMRRFLKENPDDKHGKHQYRFADTGLDLETQRRRFQHYQERFNVPTEKV